jgi:uncharacterized spore protein YtfJ
LKNSVSRAYGPAVNVAGEEIIPVAVVSFGFGGGNSPEDGQPGGSGGGGGGFVLPLGVYAKGRSGRVTFRPNAVVMLVVLAPLVCAVGVAMRGVLRTVRSHR